MKFTTSAWNRALPVIQNIKQHPFNIELGQGTLSKTIFSFYIEQDILYLNQYARCLALIAARAPSTYTRDFLRYAEGVFITEQEVVHCHFCNPSDQAPSDKTTTVTPTMATLAYTHTLLSVCALQPPEVAIAAILPCFWVYREVGRSIAERAEIDSSCHDHPYARWIETYSGKEFNTGVEETIAITDEIAATTTQTMQEQMLNAFYISTVLERQFWNDAYYQHAFDQDALSHIH